MSYQNTLSLKKACLKSCRTVWRKICSTQCITPCQNEWRSTLMRQCNATHLSLPQSCIHVSGCTSLNLPLDHIAQKLSRLYNCFDTSLSTPSRASNVNSR
ncbi:hypothetical protein PSHT_03975 [Puccinia striiformis]|uniref:Uncharacterized protein n=2 Tax=Puccinia striiformis TaxID=27350 RepID=A0A2S4V2R9_9BASI|nr:hypothetical protein PSTT_10850 [Puccinia striiformis]POW20032.1 hypothetical protein PSHT_03975 [Puccinia striiformis]